MFPKAFFTLSLIWLAAASVSLSLSQGAARICLPGNFFAFSCLLFYWLLKSKFIVTRFKEWWSHSLVTCIFPLNTCLWLRFGIHCSKTLKWAALLYLVISCHVFGISTIHLLSMLLASSPRFLTCEFFLNICRHCTYADESGDKILVWETNLLTSNITKSFLVVLPESPEIHRCTIWAFPIASLENSPSSIFLLVAEYLQSQECKLSHFARNLSLYFKFDT